MNILWIAMAAFVGAMALSLAGWFNSSEPFHPKKFIGSAITALIAGVGVSIYFDYSGNVTGLDLCIAFLIGTGADAGRKAIADVNRTIQGPTITSHGGSNQ